MRRRHPSKRKDGGVDELTADQADEMHAIADTVRDLGGKPTFTYKTNWPWYQPLVDAGLVAMGPHPDFSDDFKAVWLTPSGMQAISR